MYDQSQKKKDNCMAILELVLIMAIYLLTSLTTRLAGGQGLLEEALYCTGQPFLQTTTILLTFVS